MPVALRVVARRQHGAFTHKQALRCGMSAGEIQRRLLDGDWVVVQPGVYVCAGTPLTHDTHCWAAVLAVEPPVAVARRSAAWALRLDRAPVPQTELAELVVPEPRRTDGLLPPAHVRRMRRSRFEALRVAGLPVTPPQLTLRELGIVLPRDWVRDMVQHALRRRLVTFSGLSTQLGRGWPGAAALRDILNEVAPGYQVVWEGVLHRALRGAGLDLDPQVEVNLPGGGHAVLDLGSRRLRFGVEVDGLVSHFERFVPDLRRDRLLRRVDWQIEHVAATEVAEDLPRVVDEIVVAASIRAHQLGIPLSELCAANRAGPARRARIDAQSSEGEGAA